MDSFFGNTIGRKMPRMPERAWRNGITLSRMKALLALTLTFFLIQCYPVNPSQGRSAPLRSPFDVAAIRSAKGAPDTEPFRCRPPPSAVEDLSFTSIYDKDSKSRSIVDPELQADYKEATRPLSRYENTLAKMANRYVRSNPPRTDIAACVLVWLDSWAREDALLGDVNRVGEFVRKWSLASMASTWLQIRDEPALDTKRRKRVERWLRTVARAVVVDYTRNSDSPSRRNNHIIWAAWSVAAAGVALNDRALFDWAMERTANTIDDIAPDGTMPLEIDRENRALLYHAFAAAPLVMLAETGAVNGRDLYGARGGIIHKFVARTLDGLKNPDYFERVTGSRQDPVDASAPEKNTWLPVYESRFGPQKKLLRPKDTDQTTPSSPPFLRRTGGDMDLLFGPPHPESH